MSGVHPGDEVVGAFDTIDPKLTVFALANGMDLSKGDEYRRLEWYTEGLERGILIEAGQGEAFRLKVIAWKSGHPDERMEAPVGDDVTPADLSRTLSDSIDRANEL